MVIVAGHTAIIIFYGQDLHLKQLSGKWKTPAVGIWLHSLLVCRTSKPLLYFLLPSPSLCPSGHCKTYFLLPCAFPPLYILSSCLHFLSPSLFLPPLFTSASSSSCHHCSSYHYHSSSPICHKCMMYFYSSLICIVYQSQISFPPARKLNYRNKINVPLFHACSTIIKKRYPESFYIPILITKTLAVTFILFPDYFCWTANTMQNV